MWLIPHQQWQHATFAIETRWAAFVLPQIGGFTYLRLGTVPRHYVEVGGGGIRVENFITQLPNFVPYSTISDSGSDCIVIGLCVKHVNQPAG